jgi:hypothetical protein
MKRITRETLMIAAILFCQSALSQTIRLRAVNGKNGKPLARQRLLVFAGRNADEVRLHKHVYDLKTDDDGLVTLAIDDGAIKRIQVWADFQHLCQSTPNLRSFDIGEVASIGLSTPNDCGSISPKLVPGLLTVFARPRTRREIGDQ